MFNGTAMLALLDARPFVPFRLHMSNGGAVDVPSQEMVLPGRNFAVIGILENQSNRLASRWTTVWYMHVTQTEMTAPGAPPFTAPPPTNSDSPAPAVG